MPPKIDDLLTCVALALAAISAVMSISQTGTGRQQLQPLLLTFSAADYAATVGAVAEDSENTELPALPQMPGDEHSRGYPRSAHRNAARGEEHQVRWTSPSTNASKTIPF
jgi:hypothetical protein